jgi:hypothetical protein
MPLFHCLQRYYWFTVEVFWTVKTVLFSPCSGIDWMVSWTFKLLRSWLLRVRSILEIICGDSLSKDYVFENTQQCKTDHSITLLIFCWPASRQKFGAMQNKAFMQVNSAESTFRVIFHRMILRSSGIKFRSFCTVQRRSIDVNAILTSWGHSVSAIFSRLFLSAFMPISHGTLSWVLPLSDYTIWLAAYFLLLKLLILFFLFFAPNWFLLIPKHFLQGICKCKRDRK